MFAGESPPPGRGTDRRSTFIGILSSISLPGREVWSNLWFESFELVKEQRQLYQDSTHQTGQVTSKARNTGKHREL